MKFLSIALIAFFAIPAQANSNKARMCDAIYSEIEYVARQYQQAMRVGSSLASALRAKGQRMMNNIPADCR